MKASEIRDLPVAEIAKRLDDARAEIFNLRFQKASGQLKDTNRMRVLKRDIARMLTNLREREIVAEYQAYLAEVERLSAEAPAGEGEQG